eukprot:scaffold1263_cov134-Skeletonema_dohrnii-CCMP3373.AAC.1
MMQQNDYSPPTMEATLPLLHCAHDDRTKTFRLIDMVPDFDKITIDEEDITEDTEEMINHCAVECPKIDPTTCDEAGPKEKSIDDPTNSANRRPSGRRAAHPLKSSLKRSSDSACTASTASTSMMDESSTSTIMMDESQSSMRRRSVCFTSLEIRSYGVTLGNAPTFHGPPVTLDWDYDPAETETFDVDVYEHHRYARRTKSEMVIPPSHREYRLMQLGFSRSQIKYAMEEAKRAAKEREKTVQSLNRTRRLSLDEMWGKAKLISKRGSRRRTSADV